MKTIPPPCPEPESGRKYWRSLDQLADTPEFRQWVEREFPAGAAPMADPVTRRHFVKIMSASFLLAGAGAGLTGCRRPEQHIYPFSKMPEGYTHGQPVFYATAMPCRSSALPILAKSYDGRPIKIEGNSDHPDSNGGTDTFAQASILNLYDPDRARRFARGGETVPRGAAFQQIAQAAQAAQGNGGRGLAFLMEQSSSPTRARLQQLISKRYPQATWHVWEPIDLAAHDQAAAIAFSGPAAPYYLFDKAEIILSLDADFLSAEENSAANTRRFAAGRRLKSAAGARMNRLYIIESLLTITGMNADHRLRLPPSQHVVAAARLAQEILNGGEWAGAAQRLATAAPAESPSPMKFKQKWLAECARDLAGHRGASLVVAGYRQPLETHLLALAMNAALGNIGQTVVYREPPGLPAGTLAQLAAALGSGQVDTLVILGGNPAYDAPADLNWAQAQRKARQVFRLGDSEDETSAIADWLLPRAHYLESWGDARSGDGTVVPVQPLIEPLFGGVTDIEVLARFGGLNPADPYSLTRETFLARPGANEEQWKQFLHDGFLANSAPSPATLQANPGAIARALQAATPAQPGTPQSLEVIFHRDYSVDDGRFNNNGWLQEMPDPIGKFSWENAIFISKKTALALGVYWVNEERNQLMIPRVKIRLGQAEVEGPVWIQPGMADNTIGLALGYGRERAGRVGAGSGFNAYRLRTSHALYFASGATLTRTGERQLLATTQDHGSMEGRPIVREGNLEEFRKNPSFAKGMRLEKPPDSAPLYPNPLDALSQGAIHAWGMAIDLTACVGCNACLIACQSENNVPIVGKDQVSLGREMHWLRVDRYYAGPAEDPQAVNQPMFCQHCESAPCENVCPVNATVHDDEGLNLMVYNRCVGTRYCSNNCPYKVRRFNYFDYNRRPLNKLYESPLTSTFNGEWSFWSWLKNPSRGSRPEDEWELVKLSKNPDVTVRMRGVMEKCTFCLQRIEQAKIAQKIKARDSGDVEVPDGAIKTACQQACPAEAIVFGNLKRHDSQVSQWKAQERNYAVLDFLGTRPRLTYLARIRNPNPRMPDYLAEPYTTQDLGAAFQSQEAEGSGERGAGAPEKGAE